MVDVEDTFNAKLGVRYVIFGYIGQLGYVETSGCSAASRPTTPQSRLSTDSTRWIGRQRVDAILGRVSTRWEILRPGTEEPPRGIDRVDVVGCECETDSRTHRGRIRVRWSSPTGDFSLSIVRPSGMMPSGPA